MRLALTVVIVRVAYAALLQGYTLIGLPESAQLRETFSLPQYLVPFLANIAASSIFVGLTVWSTTHRWLRQQNTHAVNAPGKLFGIVIILTLVFSLAVSALMIWPVDVVPVDLDKPSDEFFQKSKELFDKVERTSVAYRRLVDQHSQATRDHGFPYLNSDRCAQAWAAIYDEMRATVEWIGDAKLQRCYALWSETHDRRETGILEKINGYCSRTALTQLVFLVGAAHRKAIVEKVQAQRVVGAPVVSWNLENFVD